ncbi:MAG TPA: ATP-grasp domain-containing protein, partial [Candidatus Saccharimonadales bacterium]|nr:ATP-grasp domain-containing protein [Candidatus Saccharimonadales bacterium]
DIAGREAYINLARSPLNSDNSVSLAKDKYVARLILQRHGIPNIPFARPINHDEADAFLARHQQIIAKPVAGAGACDIHLVTQPEQLHALDITEYILEKYIAGQEMRYLVLNGAVIGVHRSDYGTSVEATRDLERISYPASEWDEALVESSLQITEIMGLNFGAVDYLIDDTGCAHVLEVNTMPGLKWFHAPTSGPIVDAAGLFMEALVAEERRLNSPALVEEG